MNKDRYRLCSENCCPIWQYRFTWLLHLQVRTKDHSFDSVPHLIHFHRTQKIPIVSQESELHLKQPISNKLTMCWYQKEKKIEIANQQQVYYVLITENKVEPISNKLSIWWWSIRLTIWTVNQKLTFTVLITKCLIHSYTWKKKQYHNVEKKITIHQKEINN